MEFIETAVFSRLLQTLLTDEDFHRMQLVLMADPAAGALIRGGGGIRKLRYALPGRGKSGGVRVIYYWASARGQIYLLLIYPKSEKDTLSDREVSILRDLVKELKDASESV